MKPRVVYFLGMMVLLGCSHFAKEAPPKTTSPVLAKTPAPVASVAPPIRTVAVVDKIVVTKPIVAGCSVLSAPIHSPLPVAPDARHGQVLTDHQKLLLMQNYIWNLREYIDNEHSVEDQTYRNYINACVHPTNAKPVAAGGK